MKVTTPVTKMERPILWKQMLQKKWTISRMFKEMKRFPLKTASHRYVIKCTPEEIQKGKVLVRLQRAERGLKT